MPGRMRRRASSKASLFPRYPLIPAASPDRAWARASVHRTSRRRQSAAGPRTIPISGPFLSCHATAGCNSDARPPQCPSRGKCRSRIGAFADPLPHASPCFYTCSRPRMAPARSDWPPHPCRMAASSPAISRMIPQRVPTLPTPATFMCHVDDVEAPREEAQVVGQQFLVCSKASRNSFEEDQLRRVKQERRLVGDAGPAVHHPHALGEEMLRCSLTSLGDHLLATLARSGVAPGR